MITESCCLGILGSEEYLRNWFLYKFIRIVLTAVSFLLILKKISNDLNKLLL